MRDAFRRRPTPRCWRLIPGLSRQPVMKLTQALFYRLQVQNDGAQLRIHGAGF